MAPAREQAATEAAAVAAAEAAAAAATATAEAGAGGDDGDAIPINAPACAPPRCCTAWWWWLEDGGGGIPPTPPTFESGLLGAATAAEAATVGWSEFSRDNAAVVGIANVCGNKSMVPALVSKARACCAARMRLMPCRTCRSRSADVFGALVPTTARCISSGGKGGGERGVLGSNL